MQINYYPWNIQALSTWIDTEQAKFSNFDTFAQATGLRASTLWEWRWLQKFDITLEQINALAKYRNWSSAQVIQWLGISKMHLEDLERT